MSAWRVARGALLGVGALAAWQALVSVAALPPWILPGPARVATALAARAGFLATHAAVTLLEIALGLALGAALGAAVALSLAASAGVRRWLLPLVVASQAVPVFALAPLLVLWFGYGLASKVAMAALIVFFPVAAAGWDGLARTPAVFVRQARALGFGRGAILWRVRMPAALPAFASGLRIAAAVAPIGAVIGEWVGSAAGLGFVMTQANARMQVDLMFAALAVLALIAVAVHAAVDHALLRLLPWHRPTLAPEG